MNHFAHFDLGELKLVYRALHQHLMEHVELMDTAFFEDLQAWLQQIAGAQGVDVSDHAAWDAWLGNAHVSCEERVRGRTVIGFPEDR